MSATEAPILPDTNYAPRYLGVIGVFTVISIAVCAARIYTRVRPKYALRVDDYLILIPTIICAASYFVAVDSAIHGWGHHSAYVSPESMITAFKCSFAQQVLWIFAIALVRISIAWSLLRLSPEKGWQWTLWAIIVVQIITYVGHMIFTLFNCRPLRINWEPVYDVRCWERKYVLVFGYVANSLLVAIDFILALMPIRLIRTLHRSNREKILISCLMAMGLFAGAIAAYRMKISNETFAGDLLSSTVMMSLWAQLEALLGIVAACVATLKAPTERWLRRRGLLSSRVDMSKPSFVISMRDQEPTPPRDGSHSSGSVNTGGESGKEVRTKSAVSTVEVERPAT